MPISNDAHCVATKRQARPRVALRRGLRGRPFAPLQETQLGGCSSATCSSSDDGSSPIVKPEFRCRSRPSGQPKSSKSPALPREVRCQVVQEPTMAKSKRQIKRSRSSTTYIFEDRPIDLIRCDDRGPRVAVRLYRGTIYWRAAECRAIAFGVKPLLCWQEWSARSL